MSSALYNLSLWAYRTLLWLAAPIHPKARQMLRGRRNWLNTLRVQLTDNQQPVVWFHVASLGEFEQGRPVIEAFRAAYPTYKILLTFFSPSGYEVRKNYAGADVVAYLPFDTARNARLFLDLVQPRIALFVKYDFWYHFLRELQNRQVPTILFSAIFRPDQLFFQSWGGFYRNLLRCFDHILVQNQSSADLLKRIDIESVTVAGDTRFDRVWAVEQAPQPSPEAAAFVAGGEPVLIVGSAWPADMDRLIPFLNAWPQPLRVIVAPHDIHDADIERWRAALQKPSVRFSEIAGNQPEKSPRPHYLFIDNVGMLYRLYQYGDFAYIGGGFGRGIHNSLEAATFGLPLFFGPNHLKFQEARDLVQQGGAFPIQTTDDLTTAFARLYANADARVQASQICRQYVARNIGATAQVMAIINERLSE